MRQDRDELIRHFVARLRGQANICNYSIPCPHCNTNVAYTEQVLRDITTCGMEDNEIQLDLLGKQTQNMTLEEVIQFIEAKEAGKRSGGRLHKTQTLNATRSQYQKEKHAALKPKPPSSKETCHHCGQHGHGRHASTTTQKAECPAYGKKCEFCGRTYHFEAVCLAKKRNDKSLSHPIDKETASFDSFCSVSCPISIDHHLYNQLNDCWTRQSSKPQPFITLTTTLCPDDYLTFGLPPPRVPRQTLPIPAMADTGCQSCLVSMKIIKRFGLQQNDLIPVTMRMVAGCCGNLANSGEVVCYHAKGDTGFPAQE